MFRFLTFPPFCYVKIRKKKTNLPASKLHGFILFLLKNSIFQLGNMCTSCIKCQVYPNYSH